MRPSGELSGAVTLLAASIFALAAVLNGIENNKEVRHSKGRHGGEHSNDTANTSLAVTDDDKAAIIDDPQQGSRAARTGSDAPTATTTETANTRHDALPRDDGDADTAEEVLELSDRLVSPPQTLQGCRQAPQTPGDDDVRVLHRKSLLPMPKAGNLVRPRITGSEVSSSNQTDFQLSVSTGQHGVLATENTRRSLNLDGLFQDQATDYRVIDVKSPSIDEPTMRAVEKPRTTTQPSSAAQVPPATSIPHSPAYATPEHPPSTLDGKLRMFGSSAHGRPGMKDVGTCGPTSATDLVMAKRCDGRRLEILVHNVSHKDMVLSLRRTRYPTSVVEPNGKAEIGEGVPETVLDAGNRQPETALARPKFSLFKPSSELVFAKLKKMQAEGPGEPPDAFCTVYRRAKPLAKVAGRGRYVWKTSGEVSDFLTRHEDKTWSPWCSTKTHTFEREGHRHSAARDSPNADESISEDEDTIECADDTVVNSHANDYQSTATATRMQEQYSAGAHHRNRRISVGFDLSADPIPVTDLAGYRVRSGDSVHLEPPRPPMLASVSEEQRYRNASEGFTTSIHKRDSRGVLLEGRRDQGNRRSGVRATCEGSSSRDAEESVAKKGIPNAEDGAGEDELVHETGDDSGGEDDGVEAFITGVYFPLLSVLMPKWLKQLRCSGDEDAAKMILLVSGVGHPRNQRHRMEDNSTEVTSQLMETYLQRHYPDVTVKKVHSDTNIFRYDDNIRFVKTELMPILNDQRSRMAEEHGGDWQEMMHITLSFADGSPARISSINTALRQFRPSYIHIWELGTLWHEKKICEDDVEMHTFEDIDMLPPIPAAEVDRQTSLVIAEMLRLKNDLERVLLGPASGGVVGGNARDDLSGFWLRKTKKPVLAVLLVQKGDDSEPQLYRGTNMEVSMPTGSLCAERNVIGSALAADLSLLRRDIKAVAVLGMPRLGRTSRATPSAGAFPLGHTSYGGVGGTGYGTGYGVGSGVRPGAGGLASAVTSVYGSSAPSPSRCFASPVRTPATRASPQRRGGMGGGDAGAFSAAGAATGAGFDSRAFGKGRGADGGGIGGFTGTSSVGARIDGCGDEVEQLSGACKALVAAVAADGRPSFDTITPSFKKSSTPTPGGASISYHENEEDSNTKSCCRQQRVIGTSEVQGSSEHEATACEVRRANPRIRSESCTDELLSGGRTSGQAFFSEGGGDKTQDGSGSTNERQQGRRVARSQSFDCSAWIGYDRRGYADEESFKRALRRAKVVRSIASPRRDSLSIRAGAGGPAGAGEGRAAASNGEGRRSGGGGGGVNSVTRVQAEPFCENPLKPCGACMEWLKKIAEVNPDFKVITFTDTRCEGVFIEDVAQII